LVTRGIVFASNILFEKRDIAMSAHPSAEVEKLPSVWLFAS